MRVSSHNAIKEGAQAGGGGWRRGKRATATNNIMRKTFIIH